MVIFFDYCNAILFFVIDNFLLYKRTTSMNCLNSPVVTYNTSWFTYGYSYVNPSLSDNLLKVLRICPFNVTSSFSINHITMFRIDSLKSIRQASPIVTNFSRHHSFRLPLSSSRTKRQYANITSFCWFSVVWILVSFLTYKFFYFKELWLIESEFELN
jgi:hypothetical protein